MIKIIYPAWLCHHEHEEVEELYGVIEEIPEKGGKDETNTIIMEWLETNHIKILLDHMDSEEQNHRRRILIDFCERNGLITNTWFKERKKRMYTWKAPELKLTSVGLHTYENQ
jgi:hypothetical protein